ncbi:MAG: ATP-binding protein [Chloroflexota bacterium]
MIIQRDIYTEIEPVLPSPEAIVITGMRRVGKTTLLKFIYDQIDSTNKLYLDLENPRNQIYFQEVDYDAIKRNLELLGLKKEGRAYVFLDEIQWVKQLPSIVKYLLDTYQIKFILSGSSSFYLKNQFSESLAGRKYIFELYPLTFHEFLRMKQAPANQSTSTQTSFAFYSTYKAYMDEYLKFGGFPGVVLKTTEQEKLAALDDIFTSYYQLEVLQLSDFRKSHKIRDLLFLLMSRVGSRLDIQKLSNALGISRITVTEYLAFLEGTYFIKLVSPYTTNKDIEIRKASKLYLCDTGLVRHFAQVDEGALFENAVYWNLQHKGATVQYYQRKNGLEIDFILDRQRAYEVKTHPEKEDVNKIMALGEEIGIEHTHIVGLNYSSLPNVLYLYNL